MGRRYSRGLSSAKRKRSAFEASAELGSIGKPLRRPSQSFEPNWSEPNFELDWSPSSFAPLVSPSHPESERQADVLGAALGRELSGVGELQGGELRGASRRIAEERLGVNLEGTELRSDARAHAAARDARAHAITRDASVSFAAGSFAPGTAEGRHLIGHELTHVAQQRAHGVSATQAWSIDKTSGTAKSDDPGDTLGKLAAAVGANPNSWTCIVPLSMRSAEMKPRPEGFDGHYERFVQKGDTFDISRLLPGRAGGALHVFLFSESDEVNNAAMAKRLYPEASAVSNPDEALREASKEGATPVAQMVIIGHQVGGAMFGKGGRFEPSNLSADEPPVSFDRAKDAQLPRRCWMTAAAEARSVGCSSVAFGNAFANVYLRKGSLVMTTLAPLQPWCTDRYRTPQFDPQFPCGKPPDETVDAVRFLRPDDPGAGPFTDRASLEGATDFWIEVKGQL